VLDGNGNVWAWGDNAGSALGNATDQSGSATPLPIQGLTNVASIEAGAYAVFAHQIDGTVVAWGAIGLSPLQGGTTPNPAVPTVIQDLVGVGFVAVGGNMAALRMDGTLATWGDSFYGEGGLGQAAFASAPAIVPGLNLLNGAPSTEIMDPASPALAFISQAANITVAYTPSGISSSTLDHLELYHEGAMIATGASQAQTVSFVPGSWGEYDLTVMAVDAQGVRSAVSPPIAVTVPYNYLNDGFPDWLKARNGISPSAPIGSGAFGAGGTVSSGSDLPFPSSAGDGVPDVDKALLGLDPTQKLEATDGVIVKLTVFTPLEP
jgi:hypothetical protein